MRETSTVCKEVEIMSNYKQTGTIFDIQHFSVSDGPGIRTTVFFKGCPLRCIWCHNPESYIMEPQVMFHKEQCIQCGMCKTDIALCPIGARKLVGYKAAVEEVLAEILEDRFFFESSGGGLTLSGGEPMAQPAFALALAKAAKENGLHVCMETSGFCSREHLMQIQPYVDLFLYDYKATGENEHLAFTGVSQERILQNLFLLDELGANITLRCPMIPEHNMTDEHVEGIIQVASRLNHLSEIHLEPYHNIGISKRIGLGMEEHTQMLVPPEREMLNGYAKRIQEKSRVKVVVM